ncbi:MAG: hypothetical protein RIM72_10175 [Alphaproteobacteria bacterium]
MDTESIPSRHLKRLFRAVKMRDWAFDLFVVFGIGVICIAFIHPGQAQSLAYLERADTLACKLTGGIAADVRGDRIALKHMTGQSRLTFSRIRLQDRYAMLQVEGTETPVRLQMTQEGLTFFRATETGEIEITTIFQKPNPVGRGLMAVQTIHGTRGRIGPSQQFGVCWQP